MATVFDNLVIDDEATAGAKQFFQLYSAHAFDNRHERVALAAQRFACPKDRRVIDDKRQRLGNNQAFGDLFSTERPLAL